MTLLDKRKFADAFEDDYCNFLSKSRFGPTFYWRHLSPRDDFKFLLVNCIKHACKTLVPRYVPNKDGLFIEYDAIEYTFYTVTSIPYVFLYLPTYLPRYFTQWCTFNYCNY